MSLTNAESGQCSVYSEDQLYTADFKCTYCCTKDKCNGRIVPPHETMYTGHVTLPTTTNTTTSNNLFHRIFYTHVFCIKVIIVCLTIFTRMAHAFIISLFWHSQYSVS